MNNKYLSYIFAMIIQNNQFDAPAELRQQMKLYWM